MEYKVIDSDHQVADSRIPLHLFPLDVNRKLLIGLMAIRHQVVFTGARELVHITIKCLEVVSAPCATDAADVVTNWKFQKTKLGYCQFKCWTFTAERCEISISRVVKSFSPVLACTWRTVTTHSENKLNHTHLPSMVAAVTRAGITQMTDGRLLYWDLSACVPTYFLSNLNFITKTNMQFKICTPLNQTHSSLSPANNCSNMF